MATTPIRNREADGAGATPGTPGTTCGRPVDERRLAEDSRKLALLCGAAPKCPTAANAAGERGGGELSALFREAHGRLDEGRSPPVKERDEKRSRDKEEKAAADKPPRPEAAALQERPGVGPAAAGKAAAAERVESPAILDRCDQIVDRILVSLPRADGAQEIRLRLDAQWLPNAEVRLTSAGGELGVEFVLDAAARGFIEPRLPLLRDRLRERLGRSVAVGVAESATEDAREARDGAHGAERTGRQGIL